MTSRDGTNDPVLTSAVTEAFLAFIGLVTDTRNLSIGVRNLLLFYIRYHDQYYSRWPEFVNNLECLFDFLDALYTEFPNVENPVLTDNAKGELLALVAKVTDMQNLTTGIRRLLLFYARNEKDHYMRYAEFLLNLDSLFNFLDDLSLEYGTG